MEIEYSDKAESDAIFWIKSGNKNMQKKITVLIENILETPYEGIGKPEQLKYSLSGKWSRRITDEDRIVYEIKGNVLYVFSLKGDYL